jgi:DNA-binding MarR family transcriptional regulator
MNLDSPTTTPMPLPPLLENAKSAGLEELHRRLAERGYPDVRDAHGCVFRHVEREGVRLTDLAELAGHSKQAVGEFVADLESKGYVERVADPADRRAKIIRLTPRGVDAKQAATEIFAEIERQWAERIGEERVEALRDALECLYGLERLSRAGALAPAASSG